ncbi:phage baseplate assembly protein V [Pendulispora rubella]|uniref:Phage baseplate assembly protein V n=1 Tax=Pendulispora rubella TaxID=2741070 RepID=A0ABZ2KWH5_9BACT
MNGFPGLDKVGAVLKTLTDLGAKPKLRDPFELVAAGLAERKVEVLAIHGVEQINDIPRYDIVFAADGDATVLDATLRGNHGSLRIRTSGEIQVIQGLVLEYSTLGPLGGRPDMLRHQVRIEHKLALLRTSKKNRFFPDLTAPEVLKEVLALHGIDPEAECEFHIKRDYPSLSFTCQTDETDWEFFCRVASNAGIHFWIEHAKAQNDRLADVGSAIDTLGAAATKLSGALGKAAGKVTSALKVHPVIHFGDDATHNTALQELSALSQAAGALIQKGAEFLGVDNIVEANVAETLHYDDGRRANTDEELIFEFKHRKRVRVKSVRLMQFNVQAASLWQAEATSADATVSVKPKVGLALTSKGISAKARVDVDADIDSPAIRPAQAHRDEEHVDPTQRLYGDSQERAERALERQRVNYATARGTSNCRRLFPGARFRLGSYPVAARNRDYTVTKIVCDGVHPEYATSPSDLYSVSFQCIPSDVAPIPRERKRPTRLGLEIAEVLDFTEAGEERLTTNARGYILVRPTWAIDPEPTTVQGIVGARIAGAQDRTMGWVPVLQRIAGPGWGEQSLPEAGMHAVIGFLHGDAEQPVALGCYYSDVNPMPWPDENQKWGHVIRSRHGGPDQYCEISIDRRLGKELITIRSQRNLEEHVLADRLASIGNDSFTFVGNDSSTSIEGNAGLGIRRDYTLSVGGNVTTTIEESSNTTILKDLTELVQGSVERTVRGSQKQETVGDVHAKVRGELVTSVDDSLTANVGKQVGLTVGTHGTAAIINAHVHGDAQLVAGRHIKLFAEESLTIGVGSSMVEVHKNRVRISASAVEIVAHDGASLAAKHVSIAGSEKVDQRSPKIHLTSEGADLTMDTNAALSGAEVQLNPPTNPSPEKLQQLTSAPLAMFHVELNDPHLEPYANKRYVLELGPYRFEGATDANGAVTQQVPRDAPDGFLTIWYVTHPVGPTRKYRVSIRPMPPITTLEGVVRRLSHLGYFEGSVPKTKSAALTAAIAQFQSDHLRDGLTITGELDPNTLSVVQRYHGY